MTATRSIRSRARLTTGFARSTHRARPPRSCHRVLAATTLRPPAPWYARLWRDASPGLRVAASLAGVVAALNLVWLAGVLRSGGWLDAFVIQSLPVSLQAAIDQVSDVAVACSTIWASLGAPIASVFAPVVIAFGAACAVCGLALRQLVPGGTSHP